jgi:hypothetical protein
MKAYLLDKLLLLTWYLYSKTKWYKPASLKLHPKAKPYYELWKMIELLEKNGYLPKSKKKVKLSKSLYQY